MLFSHPLLPLILELGASEPERRLRAAQDIAQRLSQPGFLALLRRQRLTPLVYDTLSRFRRRDLGEVPHLQELRQDYLRHFRGYLGQELETRRLGSALAARGVEGILLKGGELRHLLYDDPVCRPMGDVDILIHPRNLDQVREIMASLGYRRIPKDEERIPDFNRRFAWEELYRGSGVGGVFVDIHWEIRKMGAFYRLSYEALKARARPSAQGNGGFFSPAPEHLFLNLCLDILEEWEQGSLLKVLDLKRAAERLPLDWDMLLGEARAFRMEGPLGVLLRELEAWQPGAVPSRVLAQLARYSPGLLESLILRRRPGSFLISALATLTRHIPPKEWPAYLRGKLWPQESYIRLNYGHRLAYLKHLLRRCGDKT